MDKYKFTPELLEALSKVKPSRAPRNPIPRLTRALALREPALKLLKKHGQWENWGDNAKMLIAEVGDFEIQHRTPFQTGHGPDGRLIARAAALGLSFSLLPYGLYIYGFRHSKRTCFMSLDWDDLGHQRMTTFRSGDWETELTTLAEL